MGNNCVSRLSKDGFFQLWWPRTPNFLPYRKKGKLKISKPIMTNEPEQAQEIQSKPPELFVIVRDDTKLPEPVKPAQVKEEAKPEPVHQEQPPTKAKPAQVKEEDKRQVEQPPTKQELGKIPDVTVPIQPQEVAPAEKPKPRKPHNVKRIDSAGLRADSVLKTKTGFLKDFYNLGEKLGNGQFGTTFLCVEKSTGKQYACKSIAKRKLLTRDDVDDVRREIEIMHHLSGHQNVISIKGAYEDPVAVHVVMELCSGGELFDRIVKRGHYSEKQAADLSRTIVRVIEACHSMGVMHRDLKPENFLFVDQGEDSSLKTIDFGLSIFFKPGQVFSDVVGSPYYVAPEVLLKHYGPQADVWSAGVIIYILLCGAPPFWGENEDDIFKEVLDGDLDFTSEPWPNISESAKDLLRKMLIRDPRKRLTAHEVLCHPWVRDEGAAPDKPLDSAVLSRLKQFSAMNRFKKMALRVIAGCLSEEEIAGLKEMFKALDTDNSGQITFDELKTGLKRYGASLSEPEIRDLMEAADIDRSGTIDYGEFIAAMLHLNKIEREDHLFAAFSYFDKDGSGFITMDELQQACKEFGIDDTHLEEIIREIDQNDDGRIDYDEFVAMMQKGNAQIGRKLLQNNNGLTPGFREALQVF